MKTTFLIICLSFSLYSTAQINPSENTNKYADPQNMDVVYTSEARCAAGEEAMYETIFKGLQYSEEAKNANINDKSIISFDVNFDNTLKDFAIVHPVGYGIDDQIITILKTMKFEAAIMNGIPVRQNMMVTIPIRTYPGM